MTGTDAATIVGVLAAYGPGETWDDPSRGYSRTIAVFLSDWDEGLTSPEERARLLGEFVFGAVDTGPLTDAQEERLALMALDWQIRVWLPKWLRLGGLEDHARAVEGLAEFTRPEQLAVEIPELVAAKNAAQAKYDRVRLDDWSAATRNAVQNVAWNAVRNVAWNAAMNAAWGATWDAVRNGAWNAATNVAWNAVQNAKWFAIRSATQDTKLNAPWYGTRNALWNVAWNAAMNAAQSTPDALAATVRDCQWSTQDCVRRMCAEARKMKGAGEP